MNAATLSALFTFAGIAVIAFVLSLLGVIASPTPLELVASFIVLAVLPASFPRPSFVDGLERLVIAP